MIIRRIESTLQLITQPDHAALALRIMRAWDVTHFPESARKPSILRAIEHHDDGWMEADETLIVDERSGRLVDFINVSDHVKRETSLQGIDRLAPDPYAAALVAQHRLHVYRRYADDPEWRMFFAQVTAARDDYLRAAGSVPLADLLDDYRFVRAGDLASLAFCNQWTSTEPDGCGYAMRLEGASLQIMPSPLAGQAVEIGVDARETPDRAFASRAEAQRVVAAAPIVRLTGVVR